MSYKELIFYYNVYAYHWAMIEISKANTYFKIFGVKGA